MVELLVAVAMMAALAALAIPTFIGQSEKARGAEAKAAIAQLMRNVESCAVSHPDYAPCRSERNAGEAVAWGDGPGQARVRRATGKGYVLESTSTAITSSGAPHRFWLDKRDGAVERTCAPTGEGGCGPEGRW